MNSNKRDGKQHCVFFWPIIADVKHCTSVHAGWETSVKWLGGHLGFSEFACPIGWHNVTWLENPALGGDDSGYHRLTFLLLYLPLPPHCSRGAGVVAGKHLNCVLGRDETGTHTGRYILVCVCVCVHSTEIIGEAHLDTGHLSTPPLCPSNQHCPPWMHIFCAYVCIVCELSSM